MSTTSTWYETLPCWFSGGFSDCRVKSKWLVVGHPLNAEACNHYPTVTACDACRAKIELTNVMVEILGQEPIICHCGEPMKFVCQPLGS